ncbi:type I methionyl aminopeptidase [Pedobacter sp. MC2016-24]|uniref:type I methionyl aminopeptidase n=1 Tax=Pedobacter sp. MC2016-24 TaxID=2780090 RepID=UPI00187E9A50|nr:type I methionyl aminopeptidase [Pedobacter sp. MC2016-24]MBE9599360.1 type I methionyl aminopeptidase [Pedobacter sp. MC2016-24]
MIIYKTEEEIELMKISALLVSTTIAELAKVIKPGMTTLHLDKLAGEFIADHQAVPSFLNFHGYPYNITTSVNDAVVHGFPNDVPLRDGDIISVDVGAYKNGFHGDHAYTFVIGEVDPKVLKLVAVTKQSLYEGIKQAVVGKRIGDIASAIQVFNEKEGYGVVKELVGHGLGRDMHEDPQVPNYGRKGTGMLLKENMVLAIEPMINLGTRHIYTLEDGWTVKTQDGMPSVHFEHDVCVKKGTALILSDYAPIEKAEQANQELNVSYYGLAQAR